MSWQTVVVHPAILLPWLRAQLEQPGPSAVTFIQRTVRSLGDAAAVVPCDALINASGNGARDLVPAVGDERQRIQAIRGQTHLLRTHWDRIFMRQGSQYTYCIPRLDGTAVVGGVKGVGSDDPDVSGDQQTDIFNRVGDNLPHVFAAFPADFDVVRDNVGFRPGREGGPRVEKEVLEEDGGLKVVHAYGVSGSGYGYSFGLGEVVSEMVDELLSGSPKAKL
ncbi:putative fad dependent oxidoreductase protein [Lasiodiplodia theobromae]|nr:putative fad dependent oxidoreductase protein [Lasiodiplodia theobromae]